MQQQNPPPVVSTGKIAFRYGLIFGIIQTVIALITALVTSLTDPLKLNAGLSLGLGSLIFLTSLVAYFIAGTFASRQTGKVSTGTISGLWTGVFYGVLGCIITVVLFLTIQYPKLVNQYNTVGYPANATASEFQLGLVIAGVGLPILGLFLAIGIGAGIGALGGLLGRSQARKNAPPQPYPAQPYPAHPYQGQPYPPQSYPAQPNQGPSYPGQPYPYTQPHPGQQAKPSEQPEQPAPTDWNPYNSDQPR
jgi:hypothetical protein